MQYRIDRALAPLFATLIAVLAVGAAALPAAHAAGDPVKVGFIGSFASDTGRSTLRGAEIAIEELNAGGVDE